MTYDSEPHYSIRIQVVKQIEADNWIVDAEAVGNSQEKTLYRTAATWKTLRDELMGTRIDFHVADWINHLEYLDRELKTNGRVTGHVPADRLNQLQSIGFMPR
jgi:hypothetical protein